jgi:uncharacterized protein (UPF0147 family)
MHLLKQAGQGMTMKDAENNLKYVYEIIEGFVDDTSIFTNIESNNIMDLIEKLESDGNLWAKLLQGSGGMLELRK